MRTAVRTPRLGHRTADRYRRGWTSDPHPDVPASHPSQGERPRRTPAELEAELQAAIEDIARGDYIELTPEQLERCITTGESPWPDESRG